MAKKKRGDASTERGVGAQNPKAVKRQGKAPAKKAAVPNVSGTGKGFSKPAPSAPSAGNTGGGGASAPSSDQAWAIADSLLQAYGFTSDQRVSLRNQLWGADSDLRLFYDSSAFGEMLLTKLYDTQEFQSRFPSIAEQRRKLLAGEDVLVWSPQQVMEYEQAYDVLMPEGAKSMFDKRKTVTDLILGGVDVRTELPERINMAKWAAATAPESVRAVLAEKYGVDSDMMIGFYLDPAKGEEWLSKQTATAAIRAAGRDAGLNLSWEWADEAGSVIGGGYTDIGAYRQAAQRAARGVNLTSGLGQQVSDEDLASAEFTDSAAARQRVASAAAQRVGRFNQTGGAVETQKGISGLGSASTT